MGRKQIKRSNREGWFIRPRIISPNDKRIIKSELILVCGVTFPKFRGDLSGGSGRNIFRDIKLIGIQK